jgi:hypothetical protein
MHHRYFCSTPRVAAAFAALLLPLLLLQVLYSTDEYITDPILAAVGQLQFEVVQYRMKVSLGLGLRVEG